MDIFVLNERCLLIRLGQQIDARLSEQVVSLSELLRSSLGNAIEDLTPSYASILITLRAGDVSSLEAKKRITALLDNPRAVVAISRTSSRCFDIPVLYDESVAPDLNAVSKQTGLTKAELIKQHSATPYRIFAIGFAPGFCFLGPLTPQLRIPRKTTPRLEVPAGSVAIAEQQTAIYPDPTPGGWHIIGRTPLDMRALALHAKPPIHIGDQIRFVPITPAQWDASG